MRRTERQHSTAELLTMKRFERTTTRIDTINNNCSERFARGSFERGFPTGVDVDEIEQRAEHSTHAAETLGAGCGTRFVKRQGQRLGARLPRVMLALGAAMLGLSGLDGDSGGGHTGLGQFHGLDQRFFSGFGLGEFGAQAVGFDRSLFGLGGQRCSARCDAFAFFTATIGSGPQGTELTTHLSGSAGGCRDSG